MKPVNLNRYRKAKAKTERRRQADANAAKFGRTKAQKEAAQKKADRASGQLDGHKVRE